MSTPTIKASANITLVWGVKGGANFGANAVNGSLLETLQLTPKNGSPIDIEDSDGFSAALVGLKDGFDGKATALYDSAKQMPAEGDTITVVAPNTAANGTGTANLNCTFWSWSFSRNKKKEATIELTFTNRPGINT